MKLLPLLTLALAINSSSGTGAPDLSKVNLLTRRISLAIYEFLNCPGKLDIDPAAITAHSEFGDRGDGNGPWLKEQLADGEMVPRESCFVTYKTDSTTVMWVDIPLPAASPVSQVKFYPRTDGAYWESNNVIIKACSESGECTDCGTTSGITQENADAWIIFDCPAQAEPSTKVRLEKTEGGHNLAACEVEVIGCPPMSEEDAAAMWSGN